MADLTRDQIEQLRPVLTAGLSPHYPVNLLCDMALRAAEAEKDAIERCAKVCDDFSQDRWRAYKTGDGPERADRHTEGMSDGADNCSRLIRALSPPKGDANA